MFTTQEQAANCGITVTPKFNLQIAFSMLMATQVERCPVFFFFLSGKWNLFRCDFSGLAGGSHTKWPKKQRNGDKFIQLLIISLWQRMILMSPRSRGIRGPNLNSNRDFACYKFQSAEISISDFQLAIYQMHSVRMSTVCCAYAKNLLPTQRMLDFM